MCHISFRWYTILPVHTSQGISTRPNYHSVYYGVLVVFLDIPSRGGSMLVPCETQGAVPGLALMRAKGTDTSIGLVLVPAQWAR
jgi:hypothetical protein